MLPTPRREAEVSAGPEAPRGSCVPVVLAPPPPASPVRGDNPPLGSREAEERGARGVGWWPARAAPSGRTRVPVPSGSGGERVAKGKAEGARSPERSAAGARGAGRRARAGPGCHRAAAEGRGHTHLGSPGSPPPPAGSEGRRQAGAPWAWALEPLAGAQAERSVGGLGCRPGSASCAPASTSCFARRGRGHFAAGGGRGAELLARRGSGGRGGGGLWAAPALAATRSPLLPRRPALRTGAVGLVGVSPVSCVFALG